jgi:hypothetical protein
MREIGIEGDMIRLARLLKLSEFGGLGGRS